MTVLEHHRHKQVECAFLLWSWDVLYMQPGLDHHVLALVHTKCMNMPCQATLFQCEGLQGVQTHVPSHYTTALGHENRHASATTVTWYGSKQMSSCCRMASLETAQVQAGVPVLWDVAGM